MAYQVGSLCYGSDLAATQAIAAREVGKVVEAGSVVYVVDAEATAAGAITYTLNPVGGGTALVSAQSVELQPCGLLDWEDSLTIAWAIATAWIVTFAVLQMRKAAHA